MKSIILIAILATGIVGNIVLKKLRIIKIFLTIIVIIAIIIIGVIPSRVFEGSHEARIEMCINGLKAFGVGLRMYMDSDSNDVTWPISINEKSQYFGNLLECLSGNFNYIYFRPKERNVLSSTPIIICLNHLKSEFLVVLYADGRVEKIKLQQK